MPVASLRHWSLLTVNLRSISVAMVTPSVMYNVVKKQGRRQEAARQEAARQEVLRLQVRQSSTKKLS
ncbi:MAG: hypothetical protein F6K47_35480 [Symploca sp. SIO2E6]|nr:hypothetical protein [Symploca sp. SIO2E6]